MRKMPVFLAVALFVFLLTGCHYEVPPRNAEQLSQFSYAEVVRMYSNDASNVKWDGFINTTILDEPIVVNKDAVELAEKEGPIQWHMYFTQYDPACRVWKIEFTVSGMTAQTVYMTDKGLTLLIVYPE